MGAVVGAVVGAVQPQVDEGMEAGLLRFECAEHARGCLAARGELAPCAHGTAELF